MMPPPFWTPPALYRPVSAYEMAAAALCSFPVQRRGKRADARRQAALARIRARKARR